MNNLRQIPNHWKWVTLDDISITSSGGTPDRKNSNYFKGDIPWVKSGELNYNVIIETEEYITQEALDYSSTKLFPKGSLLIALYGNTVGRMAFLGVDAATNQAVASIMSFGINQKYLYYYLMSSKEELLNRREGSAQPNISQKVLNSFPFPLAPVEEQNRIVEKIEEIFSELDKSIENLEKAKNNTDLNILSLYKQVFNSDNKWRNITIRELCYISYGKSLPQKDRVLGSIAVYGANGIVGWHNKALTAKPSIIIGRKGSVGELKFSKENCFPIDTTYYIEENDDFNLKFLFYQLQIKNLPELSKSTTIPGLNREHIYDLNILIPNSKEEQDRIVNYIEEKKEDIALLQNSIVDNIEKIKIVYQKILKDAFDGNLTNQLNTVSIETLLRNIKIKKEKYLLNQQEIIKKRPKIKRMEKEQLSIIQVLEKSKKPITPKQLWKDSMYSDNIEKFYSELKKVQDKILEKKTEKGSLISLK